MTRRKKNKYPALKKNLNTKIRQDLIDYDYLTKLSPEEKEWLNKFTEEYVSASFKKNKKTGRYVGNLHKNKQQRKDCYDRNNARNRDMFAISKTMNKLDGDEVLVDYLEDASFEDPGIVEDQVIEAIDARKKIK